MSIKPGRCLSGFYRTIDPPRAVNREDREKICRPLLRKASAFSALPGDALSCIARGCHTRTASRDQVLCEKGQNMAGFFVLVSGRVKLSILSEDGAERVLDIVLPGGTFAESAAFVRQPCPVHAQALTDSRLLYIELASVREAIARWPEVAYAMLELVAGRTQKLTADLEACCLQTATQRVAGFILREAQPAQNGPRRPSRSPLDNPSNSQAKDRIASTGEPGTDRARLTLPAAKTVVASSLNLTAETFSRELHSLARIGLIAIERREIRVPSLERL